MIEKEKIAPSAVVSFMQTESSTLKFKHFPAYALFLLENKVEEFAADQLKISREINLPLLRFFESFTEEQIVAMGNEGTKTFLTFLALNQTEEFINQSVQTWLTDQIPNIARNQVLPEDITMVSQLRRKSFRNFLPSYTQDVETTIKILDEIDQFTVKLDTICLKALSDLQQELYKQAQAMTNIGNWLWDLSTQAFIWSDELYRIYGLEPQSVKLSSEFLTEFNHPDDADMIQQQMEQARQTLQPYDFFYRIILKNGEQKTLHAKGRVETNPEGVAVRMVGTLQNVTERQQLIDRLQESELLFNQAQSLTHIGNWGWDVNADAVLWSDELYRIYGLEPQSEKISFDRFLSLVHPDDREMVGQQIQQSLEKRLPSEFYHRILLADGTIKTLHAKGELVFDNSGKPIKMIGTGQDVTLQKETEKRLIENQVFIEKIANVTPSLITAYNVLNGEYLFINQAVKTLLDYPVEDVMQQGMNFFSSLIHPEDLTSLQKKQEQALELANKADRTAQTESITEFQYRIKHNNGQYRWFNTYSTIFTRNKNNKVEDILTISVDITEQVLARQQIQQKNEEIRRNEERYHRMIDEVQDYAILLLNREGNIQNWNTGAEKIKGYTADEIIGKNFSIFYTDADRKNGLPFSLIEQAVTKGKATHEGWRVRKDGTLFWGSTVITSLHDKNNDVIGFTKVTRDLTERKLSEDRLIQYAQRLEQKNTELEKSYKELESFSYIASHDLQEPLRKIQTFSNRILEKSKEVFTENTLDYFNRIIASATHMQKLIDALLDYSHNNSPNIVFRPVDLNNALEEVKSHLHTIIEEKNVRIEATPLPVVQGVAMQIQQVFSNIIGNAIKYSKKDVQPDIKISASVISAKEVLPASDANNCYKITISDNGIGFDQQYADKIFELFQRLHGKTEYSGTGIGLAICKKIIQNHGGTIKATGEPGIGSTFIIYLPIIN